MARQTYATLGDTRPPHFLWFGGSALIGGSYYLTTFNKNFLWLANLGFFL